MAWWILLGLAIGAVVGYFIARYLLHRKSSGCVRIDNSDGDGPYLFLELGSDPNALSGKKYVTFEVKVQNFISHK
jgi:hypothetical protein